MKFSNKILAQTIIQLCLDSEINHVVISPGSRNAPLIVGFTEHPDFINFSIVDERCAGFFALGLAQQLKKPVALVCTSGSALLNYYPAVAEAYYSDIPLVIISSDRPANLIDIGDGQTIRQEGVFSNHILCNANCIEGEIHRAHNEKIMSSCLNIAIEQNGPVHINIPFSEPLYSTINELQVMPKRFVFEIKSELVLEDLTSFLKFWNNCERKMLIVGVLAPESIEQKFIDILGTDESVIVLTETTSNLHHENFFPSIDQLIAPLGEDCLRDLQPEVLLTFGGMIVSKKIKAFLRTYSPKAHWHVDSKKAYNTFFCLDHHFKISPNKFLRAFLPQTKNVTSSYQNHWASIRQQRLEKHQVYEQKIVFSDFKVFSEIFKSIPANIQLQLSNSSTIRYAQLFDFKASIKVFCNRGTSGIDGSTSTAIGAAWVSKLPTVLVTGDLSFLYDSNALWNNYIPSSFRFIVINNSGGGIFRILPGAKETTHFEEFFETSHSLSAIHLCEMHCIYYASASNDISLKQTLNNFFEPSEKPKLLEIFTPAEINDTILKEYFQFIK